jgi:hypothetical protein
MVIQVDLPDAFDLALYRAENPDLRNLSDEQLIHHYSTHGQNEGRICSAITGRQAFLEFARRFTKALEIGPFFSPGLAEMSTDFFDVLTTEELRKRAEQIGQDPSRVPHIRWHHPNGSLSGISEKYQICYSSHNLEHQPNLIGHLHEVQNLLNSDGLYFLVIPDHRYCFDALLSKSTVADVIEAHLGDYKRHTIRSVVEHRALVTHNDVVAHWKGDNGYFKLDSSKVADAIREYQNFLYLDVHAWKFTPDSFREIINTLSDLKLTSFVLERVYPTLRWTNEFFAVLRVQSERR